MQDEHGNQITFEEWEFRNKYIDFKPYQFAEENPIDFVNKAGNKIANYRQPVPEGQRKKGIIMHVHGYGSSTYMFAFLAH